MCIYIYKQGWKYENSSTKITMHVEANVKTQQKGNQDPRNNNNNNEVEDIMLKGHPLSQIS